MAIPKIVSLHIYPLKSAQGISLNTMTIEKTGPLHDREWMLVDKNNNFVTQRTHPQMSLIATDINDDLLTFSAPGSSPLQISISERFNNQLAVSIFRKTTTAELGPPQAHQWFSELLQQPVHLVRALKNPERQTSGNHGPINPLLFPDGYPLLLTNKATLDELNAKLPNPVTMNRFRPNIVISGAEPNEEDLWTQFDIGALPFLSVKACTRCVVIDINPKTGKKESKVVSQTLKDYRTKNNQVIFGCNLTHQGMGQIHVGQTLTKIHQ